MEIWKESRLDSHYEVSNLGRIRSKERTKEVRPTRRTGPYKRVFPAKLMKPFYVKSTGYTQVNLTGHTRVSVHRMVALEHCDGYAEGLVVNHKNGVRDDNRAENLEWTTMSGNLKHAFRVLGRKPVSLGKFSTEHPTSKSVISTNPDTGEEIFYGCGLDAVRAGYESSAISRCVNGINKHHKGLKWRLASLEEIEAYSSLSQN